MHASRLSPQLPLCVAAVPHKHMNSTFELCTMSGIDAGRCCLSLNSSVTACCVQSGIGVPYVSKMEALQEFVQRAKMTGLDLHATSAHPSPSQKGLAELQQSAHHPHEPPTGIKGQSSSRASSSQAQLENSQQLSRKHQAQQSAPRLILVNDLPHAHDASQRAVLLDTIGGQKQPCMTFAATCSIEMACGTICQPPQTAGSSPFKMQKHCPQIGIQCHLTILQSA